MKLIHTALLCEAMPIIEKFKLKKTSSDIYKNDDLIVAISGIGEKKTKECLNKIFSTCKIKKAINIGIAGCKDKSIKLGEIFCINKEFQNIKTTTLTTVKKPTCKIDTTLVDMEARTFMLTCKEKEIDFLVFKVVSDYLDEGIPKKAYVSFLIKKSLDKWIKYI